MPDRFRSALHVLLVVGLAAPASGAGDDQPRETPPQVGAPAPPAPAGAVDASSPGVSSTDASSTIDVVPETARAVLNRALENRYDLDARASLEVTIVARSGKRDLKRAEIASKRINGEIHSVGRFTYPEDVRDLAVLRQGRTGKDDEYFAYLPEFRRVRRLPDPPKADMFFGSDANFEDIERRHIEDYEVTGARTVDVAGEEAYLVQASPTYDSGYGRVDYLIAKSDFAILEQRLYRKGKDEPWKIARAPREHTRSIGGHAIPMQVTLDDLEHGTRTELRILEVRVNPKLPDRIFTIRALSEEEKLPAYE